MIWTEVKDQILRDMYVSGASADRIAAVLRCHPRTVESRIDRLGLKYRPLSLPRVKWLERPDP